MKQGILATVIGRAVADPDLRFSNAGKAIGKLRVVATDRRKNDSTGQWEDGDSTFLDVTVFGFDAETIAEEVKKGDQVIATGRLKTREYQKRDGSTGFALEIVADGFGMLNRLNKRSAVTPQATVDDPWTTPEKPIEEAPF